MENKLTLSVSPHIHSGRSTAAIMRDVIIALLPTTIAGAILFGGRSLLVVGVTVLSSVLFEFFWNLILKKEQTITDLSAALTGLLLALNLPSNTPLWQCVMGSLFAIVAVKCIFGGLGHNVVNPAITARVFMLVAFPNLAQAAFPVDVVAGATPLSAVRDGGTVPSLLDLLLGKHGGAIGEVCALALLVGLVYLLLRRVITWYIPVSIVGSVFLLTFLTDGFDLAVALTAVLSGGLLIGAIFMATDYVTSPATWKGKLVYGVFIGAFTFLIRTYGNYPEGVSFAILLGNIVCPYIERLTAHKVFGGDRR